MATFTFDSLWSNIGGEYAPTLYGDQTWTITVPDGETITTGETVVVHGSGGDEVYMDYAGMLPDGSPGFTIFQEGGSVFWELTNETRTEGDPFPSDSAFNSSLPLVCFLPGTLIATPDGARPVEDLAEGDTVLEADGRTVRVKWIGRQTVFATLGMVEGRRPVCIAVGALGGGLPARDLKLTADHALLIDGVLVHAGALVNGTTIRRMALAELGQRFTVYHIETENHEIILAEGTPAETFIDNVSRTRFDNYTEYEALYGPAPAPMAELEQPRAMSRRQVPASIHARIATAAAHILAESEQAA